MASSRPGHGFGTGPVVLAGLGTILGAILFLRFGYAVGHVGLWGALGIVALGHLVTVPTSLAIAELATNRKVEGGGEYFIISRSFGATIGTTIGISLYLSQAISVAFYMLAFAESFEALAPWLEQTLAISYRPLWISLPSTLALVVLMLTRGAALGVGALYVVAVVLGLALLSFFLGSPLDGYLPIRLGARVGDADAFFIVFAVVFPAFTGMTAGVGLSGDLANPRRSIPTGTLTATLLGLAIYLAVVVKLAFSAPPDALAERQLIMAEIALYGPMVYVGLGCATLSSAIGSILVAPRTLQAIGSDEALPWPALNRWLGQGKGPANEPRNTTLLTGGLAIAVVSLGSIDVVARLISMFFMVTYGSLCAISFLEHFAARPSYRPTFQTRWYASLFGAIACLLLAFQMDPVVALVAIGLMIALYRLLHRGRRRSDDLAAMFAGVMSQLTRYLNLRLQRRRDAGPPLEWRPSIITLSSKTFERQSPLRLMSWLCDRQGFGTYLHHIPGRLDAASYEESVRQRHRLLERNREGSRIFMDTLVSPSAISALAQAIQIPGVAGVSNNPLLLELSTHDPPEERSRLVELTRFAASVRMAVLVLRHGDRFFGQCARLHVWLTWNDEDNATLMILLAYVILGHHDWSDADVRVFAALPGDRVAERRRDFLRLVEEGRLPLPRQHVRFMPVDDQDSFRRLVGELSADADLTLVGFDLESIDDRGGEVFQNHPDLEDVLFVHAPRAIDIA